MSGYRSYGTQSLLFKNKVNETGSVERAQKTVAPAGASEHQSGLAMDVVSSLPEVDPERIVTFGGSQGGALSIAASALSGKSQHCFSSITSYCCLDQRTELGSGMFRSLHEYLQQHPVEKEQALGTLTYFDTLNMVSLLKVPVSFCLCLADPICLPEFVYSAYAHTPGEKEIDFYPNIGHRQPQAWRYYAYTKISKL